MDKIKFAKNKNEIEFNLTNKKSVGVQAPVHNAPVNEHGITTKDWL